MRHLLILGCSAAKRPDAGLLPAFERYDGPAWRVLRRWQRVTPRWEERLTVWVLSARYGLFDAGVCIPVYEQRLTPAFAARLRPAIAQGLRLFGAPSGHVLVSLGADYRAALPELPWPHQLATGGIGSRLGQLKGWLEGLVQEECNEPA